MGVKRSVGLILGLVLATAAQGQPAAGPPPPMGQAHPTQGPALAGQTARLDTAARKAIVAALAKNMREGYVEPDVGARAADRVERALANGQYDALDGPADFAARLTADLSEIAHDKHLRIVAPGSPPPVGAPPGPWPDNDSGVVRADRLSGDIGYIEVIGFPPPAHFKAAIDRAMGALAGSRALIVDMRRNGGGDPQGVAYLVSFFVAPKTSVHVMDLLWRKSGTTEYATNQTFTSVTPTTFQGKPVYVLTSRYTFSGGEEFCYDLQSMKLGVLVGETTGGGANPGGERPLGSGLTVFLPGGKARSPITGRNWEGVGVAPDIAVAPDQALKVALEKLGRAPATTGIDTLSQARLFHLRDVALPGTEAALRRMIGAAARGQPDYDQLTPDFAAVVREQAANVGPMIAALGPIQSVTFHGPGAGYGDRYEVRFAKGAQIWSLTLAPDGKVSGAAFGPAPSASPAVTPAERR